MRFFDSLKGSGIVLSLYHLHRVFADKQSRQCERGADRRNQRQPLAEDNDRGDDGHNRREVDVDARFDSADDLERVVPGHKAYRRRDDAEIEQVKEVGKTFELRQIGMKSAP